MKGGEIHGARQGETYNGGQTISVMPVFGGRTFPGCGHSSMTMPALLEVHWLDVDFVK